MDRFIAFLGPLGWPELMVILVVALIIFGPRRLPEIAEAFGKSIRKFRSATKNATDEVRKELDDINHEPPEGSPPDKGSS